VIVNDLDAVGISTTPHKTDPPSIVDTDAMLPLSASAESLQPIARGRCQIAQLRRNVQLPELSLGDPLEGAEPPDPLPGMELFRLFRTERLDHTVRV
jgi:hypothetical protein